MPFGAKRHGGPTWIWTAFHANVSAQENTNTTSPEFNISSMKRLVVRMGSPRSLSTGKPTAQSVDWSNLG